MSLTSRREVGLESIAMIRFPSGVVARLMAEATPGSLSSRAVSTASRSIPSGVNRSGSS